MLDLPDAWIEAFEQDGVRPVYLVGIEVGVRGYFTVADWEQAAGITLGVTTAAGHVDLVEGQDWIAEVSDTQTAANIAEALMDSVSDALTYAQDDQITLVLAPGAADPTLTTTEAPAVAVRPSIFNGGATPGVLRYVSGDQPRLGADPVVVDVTPVKAELDPVSRVYTTGDRHITFGDNGPGDVVRMLLTEFPDLKGKIVRVRLGAAAFTANTLQESDYVDEGAFMIADIEQGGAETPEVTLICKDLGGILRDAEIIGPGNQADVEGDFQRMHPLTALAWVLARAGVPPEFYDAASLDPTNYPDIGHWNVARLWPVEFLPGTIVFENGVTEPVNARDLANSLLEILDGYFLPDESGVFRFKRYDPEEAPVATIEEDEVQDFVPAELFRDFANHVVVTGAPHQGSPIDLFEREDRNSQNRYAPAGGNPIRITHPIESDWLNGVGFLRGTLLDTDTHLIVQGASKHGFAGARFLDPGMGQEQYADASPDRLVYLLLYDSNGHREIISCDGADRIAYGVFAAEHPDRFRGVNTPHIPFHTGFQIAERGLFGTSATVPPGGWDTTPGGAQGLNGVFVVDITIPIDLANRKLVRLAHGIPIVEFTVGHHRYGIQEGDQIYLNHSRLMDHGIDGVTSSNMKYEVIGKEPNAIGDAPGVRLTCAGIRRGNPGVELVFIPGEVQLEPVVIHVDEGRVIADDGSDVLADDGTRIYA